MEQQQKTPRFGKGNKRRVKAATWGSMYDCESEINLGNEHHKIRTERKCGRSLLLLRLARLVAVFKLFWRVEFVCREATIVKSTSTIDNIKDSCSFQGFYVIRKAYGAMIWF